MAGNSVALDTNIVVAHFRNPGRHDSRLAANELFLPVTVLAELFAGAEKSAQPTKNRKVVEAFRSICNVLNCDESTASRYGEIWSSLAEAGQMIPTNDIWIAALAMQHGLPLVTEDGHFSRISGLSLESW